MDERNGITPPAIVKADTAEMDQFGVRASAAFEAGDKAARTTLERYREAGEWITKAKAKSTHGLWLPWLKKHGISPSMASRAMRVAANWSNLSHVTNLADAFTLLAKIEEEKEIEQPPAPPMDKERHPIPDTVLEAFTYLPKFEESDTLIKTLQKNIDDISKTQAGFQLRAHLRPTGAEGKTINKSEQLNALKGELRSTRPYSVCPYCQGKALPLCRGCTGAGWVSKMTWDSVPEDMKKKLNVIPETVSE